MEMPIDKKSMVHAAFRHALMLCEKEGKFLFKVHTVAGVFTGSPLSSGAVEIPGDQVIAIEDSPDGKITYIHHSSIVAITVIPVIHA